MEQNDLTMRPINGREELDLFSQLPYVLNPELADGLAAGRRRPEWMWVAQRGDRLLARAAWWSRPGGDAPLILDVLDIDERAPNPARLDIGVRLLRTAMAAVLPDPSRPPEYSRFIPPDWRDNAATRQVVEDRMTVLERTGARLFVERLRLEWNPTSPVPGPGKRLLFRPVQDAGELVALMALVLDGTLDATATSTTSSPKEPASSPSRVFPVSEPPRTSATSPWRTPSGGPSTSTSGVRST